jgi:hypothetical protein
MLIALPGLPATTLMRSFSMVQKLRIPYEPGTGMSSATPPIRIWRTCTCTYLPKIDRLRAKSRKRQVCTQADLANPNQKTSFLWFPTFTFSETSSFLPCCHLPATVYLGSPLPAGCCAGNLGLAPLHQQVPLWH